MDLGPYAAFIWTSYAIVGVVVSALIFWLIYDGNRLARRYQDLERRGLTRRSSRVSSNDSQGPAR